MKSLFIFALCCLCSSLSTAQTLHRILTTFEPPTNYVTEGGELTGTSVEIVREIQRRIGSHLAIEIQPWARAFAHFKRHPEVLAFTAGKTPERERMGFHFIGPVFTRQYVLIAKKGSQINIDHVTDLQHANIVIGSMRGDWRSQYFKARGIEVEEVTVHSQNVHKLVNRRIDLWATSDIEAHSIMRASRYSASDLEVAYRFKSGQSYLMFSKGTSQATLARWRRAFELLIDDGFMHTTAQKWGKLLELDLAFAPDKGFYIKQ